MNQKKVLFLVNHDVVIYNFRRELVEELINQGFKVYISSPYGSKIKKLIDIGCIHIDTQVERHGTNPINEILLLHFYKKIIKKVKPDIILTYTIKPNIYGSLASNKYNIPSIVNITGLGTSLQEKSYFSNIILSLYRYSFKKVGCIFFQNEDNRDFFTNNKILMNNYRLIPGSGVNVSQFNYQEYPQSKKKIKFLFIGRIMKDKGIEELIEAAKIIKDKYSDVEFEAVGFVEEEYRSRVEELKKLNIINFLGVKENIQSYITESHAVVLPSYHEGMANVLLEAASTGRPILASNISGCKETFEDGVTGIAFESHNVQSLTEALTKFLYLKYEEKKAMGILGRKKMENEFDRKKVVNAYTEEINTLIN